MEFSKVFEFHKIPEWMEFYLSYDSLSLLLANYFKNLRQRSSRRESAVDLKEELHKDILNFSSAYGDKLLNYQQLSTSYIINDSPEAPDIKFTYNQHGTSIMTDRFAVDIESIADFFEAFKKSILKVENFYVNKLVRLKESFANFQSKLDMKQTKIISERNSEESKSNSKRKAPSKNISKQDIEIETRERDELGYAVSWKRAFKFIYKKATWIHSYADINKIAVDQIIKEFEDLIKSSLNDIQIEDSKRVFNDIQEFLKKINFYFKQSKEITIFRKSLVEFYADNFTKANLRKAKIELQEDISNINLKDLRVISFNLGAVITLGLIITFLVILFTGVDPEEGTTLHSISIWVFFPAFSFSFSLILILYLLSFCLYVWRKYNINYVYIFEIDPKFRLSEYQILKSASTLTIVWLVLIFLDLSALKFDFLRSYFYIYPMIAANYLIAILFIPFHLFFRTARYSLLVSFVKCLFPFGESGVRFRDYIVGAILTAMSRPIQAFVQSFYYFTCKPCLSNNENEFGFSRINNFTLFFNPLGYFIRMIQSINRLYYTKLIWPHFVNFVKFVYAVFSQVYLWLYYGGYYQSLYQTFVVHLISNLSLLFWDFYVDWGVFRTLDNRYFLLRKNIMFPPWVYYISMVINTILRLYFYFELFDILDRRDEFYQFIAISLEIFRRMLWLLIRLENEHQNNPEKYREVLSIPQLVEA